MAGYKGHFFFIQWLQDEPPRGFSGFYVYSKQSCQIPSIFDSKIMKMKSGLYDNVPDAFRSIESIDACKETDCKYTISPKQFQCFFQYGALRFNFDGSIYDFQIISFNEIIIT